MRLDSTWYHQYQIPSQSLVPSGNGALYVYWSAFTVNDAINVLHNNRNVGRFSNTLNNIYNRVMSKSYTIPKPSRFSESPSPVCPKRVIWGSASRHVPGVWRLTPSLHSVTYLTFHGFSPFPFHRWIVESIHLAKNRTLSFLSLRETRQGCSRSRAARPSVSYTCHRVLVDPFTFTEKYDSP